MRVLFSSKRREQQGRAKRDSMPSMSR
jgi:hypothetical protein